MKKNAIFLLALLASAILSAAPVSRDRAQRVAENFWTASTHTKCQSVLALPQTDFQQFYIFDIDNGRGFVIVAADDHAYPVLGYSAENPATIEIGAEIRFWLNQYEQEITWLAEQEQAADPFVASAWKQLLEGSWSEPKATTSVSPMLTTTWNQNPYYNNLCPSGTPAGCSAIAMAQVMKYWNHPAQGIGSHTYTHNTYGTLSADFGATTYDWNNMPNALTSGSSAVQKNAVATLCYHCGVSINMDYGPSGSGAAIIGNSNSVKTALVDYFGYKSTLLGIYKSSYADTAWVGTLERELEAGRPIVYAGFDSEAGHAFVFDGCNASHQFHVNWGWGGAYNGYFSIGALNPYGGGTGSNNSNTFNLSNQAIIGIQPVANLRISSSNLIIPRAGTAVSMVVYSNTTDTSRWTATTDESWVLLNAVSGPGNGAASTLQVSAADNTTGQDRFATITFIQGTDTCITHVAQLACNADEMCTLTVNMLDRYEDGWEGASLTLSKPNGVIYGTATSSGHFNVQSFAVCADTVLVTWNAGSHDSECSFFIDNADGAVLFNHSRGSAISGGLIATIAAPCDTTGASSPIRFTLSGQPNIEDAGYVEGAGDGIRFGTTRTIKAIAYDGYRFVKWADGVTNNPRNVTVTEDLSCNPVYATIGNDTMRYDNNVYNTALGINGGFHWGIRFPSSDWIGRPSLSGIAFYALYGGTYQISIQQSNDNANAPGDVLMQGNITVGSNQTGWVTVNIDGGVEIPHNKSVWICLYAPQVSYPAAMTESWCGNDNGCMISSNGTSWRNLHDAHSRWNTWMIRAIAPIDHNDYTATLTVSDSAAGRVWLTGTDTLVTVTGSYRYGEKVRYGAEANDGWRFVRWSDGSTRNPYAFFITEPWELQAVFEYTGAQSIDEASSQPQLRAWTDGLRLSIAGADGSSLQIFDVMGRCLFNIAEYDGAAIMLPAEGVYVIRADGYQPRKVLAY